MGRLTGASIAWLVVASLFFVGPPLALDCPFRTDHGVVIVQPEGGRTEVNHSAAMAYEDLSPAARAVLGRALPDGATTVCGADEVPEEFAFTTDEETRSGTGLYALEYRGDYYAVRTRAVSTDYGPPILGAAWLIGAAALVAATRAYRSAEPLDQHGDASGGTEAASDENGE